MKRLKTEPEKELTKAELEVMQILWKLKKAFVGDILDRMVEPKPAYNTVSTVVRLLEKKGEDLSLAESERVIRLAEEAIRKRKDAGK